MEVLEHIVPTAMMLVVPVVLVTWIGDLMASEGTVVYTTFFSNAMGEDCNVGIYLPAGYDPNGTTRYPVIYYLHGMDGDHRTTDSFIHSVLDGLIGGGAIGPVLVAMPDGGATSWFRNSKPYGRVEDYIVLDLVAFIDTHYKTIADRNSRCIMGMSKGGDGAMRLAFRHPDVYRGVASHSGNLDLSHWIPTGARAGIDRT